MVNVLVQSLLHLVYPSLCFNCSRLIERNEALCFYCLEKVQPVVSLMLPITAKKHIKVFAVGAYQEPLKCFIVAKFSQNLLASKKLAELMPQLVSATVFNDIDVIVPVPLHWFRYARRGYNQAVVIARRLGNHFQLPVYPALKRTKNTYFQSLLNKDERADNVKDAFGYRSYYKQHVIGKHILLIDDLFTSGATVKSAAKMLFKAGASNVTVLVGCRKV